MIAYKQWIVDFDISLLKLADMTTQSIIFSIPYIDDLTAKYKK